MKDTGIKGYHVKKVLTQKAVDNGNLNKYKGGHKPLRRCRATSPYQGRLKGISGATPMSGRLKGISGATPMLGRLKGFSGATPMSGRLRRYLRRHLPLSGETFTS